MQFLEEHFGSCLHNKHEVLFHCPFCHHHKKKLSVNLDTLYWKCWVCDAKGRSLSSLVWQHRDPNVTRAYKKAFPHKPLVVDDGEDTQPFALALPDGYRPLCVDWTSFHARRACSFLKRRRVSADAIVKHKIGYVADGPLRDRIILPSFDADGRLNFYTARTFAGHPRKYMNPDTPAGYKKRIVLNELNLDWTRPVTIVEGFFDMLRVDNAVPLFGSTLARDAKLLVNLVVHDTTTYVALDADARQKQHALLQILNNYGVCCYDIDVAPYRDLGEMTARQIEDKRQGAHQADRVAMLHKRLAM